MRCDQRIGVLLVQGFNMAVRQASMQLPEAPAELDKLIKRRLNKQSQGKHTSHLDKQ